ncbi:hypothetical protein HSRCO_0697 [Halanaeroarchaeum sp. HSR-CO]|uniref:hypothetical protein n=1 Tax=Halanaeroarchaeum sp. HSR-CO TaxID=2866382 RepID=UPI00217E31A8|nr:hypothetical protein [Halanaeroarchaeum sp. HSR-CO]UWG46992.1 hypothetical protein HSRCO_0697 [Halanaeroarchaeum sp. HSR-CO]
MYEQMPGQQPPLSGFEQSGTQPNPQQVPLGQQPPTREQSLSQQTPQFATQSPPQQRMVSTLEARPQQTSTEYLPQRQSTPTQPAAQQAPIQRQQPSRQASTQSQLPDQWATAPQQQEQAFGPQQAHQTPVQGQQPIQQAPVQGQQPIQQAPVVGWSEQGHASQQPSAMNPQFTQRPGEFGQYGAGQAFERQAQPRAQEMPTRQAVEMAETPVIAEVLARRLGMTGDQLAQYLPQLAPFVGGQQLSATGQWSSPFQATRPQIGQQPSTLQPISHQ